MLLIAAAALLAGCAFFARLVAPPDREVARWEGGVEWLELDTAVEQSRETGKPIVLVVYTDWCAYCRNYSWVVSGPEVKAFAGLAHFVRLDGDRADTSEYAPDGEYYPRTLVLAPGGAVDPSFKGPARKHSYSLNDHDPEETVAVLRAAIAKYPGGRER